MELHLPLLPTDQAGYLDLLFSTCALAEGGSVYQIQQMTNLIGRSPDQPGTSSFASATWGRSHKDAWAGCTVCLTTPST